MCMIVCMCVNCTELHNFSCWHSLGDVFTHVHCVPKSARLAQACMHTILCFYCGHDTRLSIIHGGILCRCSEHDTGTYVVHIYVIYVWYSICVDTESMT